MSYLEPAPFTDDEPAPFTVEVLQDAFEVMRTASPRPRPPLFVPRYVYDLVVAQDPPLDLDRLAPHFDGIAPYGEVS